MDIYQKYYEIKKDLVENPIEPTGINDQLENVYLTLQDIKNRLDPWFIKLKVMDKITPLEGVIKLELIDLEKLDDSIEWVMDLPVNEPIKNREGRAVTSRCQAYGGSLTYMTRRAYKNAFGITEKTEDNDGNVAHAPTKQEKARAKATANAGKQDAGPTTLNALKTQCETLKKFGNKDDLKVIKQVEKMTNNYTEGEAAKVHKAIIQVREQIEKRKAESEEAKSE